MHFNTDHEFLQNGDHLIFRAIPALVVASLLLLMAAGCVAKQSATSTPPHAKPPKAKPPVVVTEADADKPIQISVGQTLQLRLPSNPTTGYSWNVQHTPDQLQLDQSAYAADPHGKNVAGAGGYQTIEFAAKFPGTGELRLEYRRPWEKDVPPAETFSVIVTVK